MFEVYPEHFAFKLITVLQSSTRKICHFLKKWSFYGTFCCPFYFEIKCYSQVTKTLYCFKVRNFQYIIFNDKEPTVKFSYFHELAFENQTKLF